MGGQQQQTQQLQTQAIAMMRETAQTVSRFSEEVLATQRQFASELLHIQRRVIGEAFGPDFGPDSPQVQEMSVGSAQDEGNRRLAGRLFQEAVARGQFERIDQYAEGPAVEHLRKTWGSIRGLLPDCQVMVEDIYTSEHEKLAVRLRITGTHDGSVDQLQLEPTGRKVDVTAIELLTIRNGRIVESWSVIDYGQFARQLDVETRQLADALT